MQLFICTLRPLTLGWMDRWSDGGMDGRMDSWTVTQTVEYITQVMALEMGGCIAGSRPSSYSISHRHGSRRLCHRIASLHRNATIESHRIAWYRRNAMEQNVPSHCRHGILWSIASMALPIWRRGLQSRARQLQLLKKL